MEELKDQIIGEVNKQIFQEYRNLIDSKDKEIERLNNIIEELEKLLKEEEDRLVREQGYTFEDYGGNIRDVNEKIFDEVVNIAIKLKELKERK